MLGSGLLYVAFGTIILSLIYYFVVFRGNQQVLLYARGFYLASVVSVLAAGGVLMFNLLTHKFQYTYVWEYSSTDLSLPLLISTFFAGQEGSFMLWTLFTVIIGAILMRYVSKKNYEPEVMMVYAFITFFLILMMIVKSPFSYIWESFPKDTISSGPIPPDVKRFVMLDEAKNLWSRIPVEGKGLNPLLQNFWMVIHPPVLFVGFATLAVPFVLAIAALIKREYTNWVKMATPWLVFSGLTLGLGIILGGYWAYETLGWGGYWAWDPVENSSLVPWILVIAAIHTTIIQRKSGQFVRTNFLLMILAFVAVLYSTFLTRSGVLGATSVHSFVDPGMWAYAFLLAFLLVFLILGIALLILRMKEMPRIKTRYSFFSREFALFLGAFALTFSAFFIIVGTSAPLITSIIKGEASAVEISYYITTNLPLAIIITFLTGFAQFLWWKRAQSVSVLKDMIPAFALALVDTVAVAMLGPIHIPTLLFAFCAAYAVFANLQIGWKIFIGNPRFVGGSITHLGFAIMCIGFVTSSKYDTKETASLALGKPVPTLGYTLKYTGSTQLNDGRFQFNVEIEHGGSTHKIAPIMYYSQTANSLMRIPDIVNLITKDLYISPLGVEEAVGTTAQPLELKRNIPATIKGLKLTFKEFNFKHPPSEQQMSMNNISLTALVNVQEGKKNNVLSLLLRGVNNSMEAVPVDYKGSDGALYRLALVSLNPQQPPATSSITINVLSSADPMPVTKPETLLVEASIKPMINLVWAGTITLLIGFIVTIMRRSREVNDGQSEETETSE
jgi:cytochrome c-type biogenesis protein CcmF